MYSAFRTFNRILSEGVIEIHAIGRAIAAAYYFNAFPAEDIDVFIFCRRECRERDLPEPAIESLYEITIKGRERRPIHFHRFRSKRGLTQPDTHGGFWKLTFSESVPGPLALGFGSHYGFGIFRACESEQSQAIHSESNS